MIQFSHTVRSEEECVSEILSVSLLTRARGAKGSEMDKLFLLRCAEDVKWLLIPALMLSC